MTHYLNILTSEAPTRFDYKLNILVEFILIKFRVDKKFRHIVLQHI